QAAMVGHRLKWQDDLVGLVVDNDRRSESAAAPKDLPPLARSQRGRIVAALADLTAVVGLGLMVGILAPIGKGAAVAGCAVLYHAVSLSLLGCTPSVWALDTYVVSRHPRAGSRRFLRLARSSER